VRALSPHDACRLNAPTGNVDLLVDLSRTPRPKERACGSRVVSLSSDLAPGASIHEILRLVLREVIRAEGLDILAGAPTRTHLRQLADRVERRALALYGNTRLVAQLLGTDPTGVRRRKCKAEAPSHERTSPVDNDCSAE